MKTLNLPYLRLVGRRGRIKIYLVDGAYVRTNLDEEFTNFGQHYRFACILKNEFWIDHESSPDERRFFIDHLLVEWKLMKAGMSYDKAIDLADIKERSERFRSRDLAKVESKSGLPDPSKVHLKILTHAGPFTVYLVDGRLVRSNFDINFTEGGHDLVYTYVPENEVWLDNDLSASELSFVLLHELFERSLMAKGLTYNQAHRHASKLEWRSRHHSVLLISSLKKLNCTSLDFVKS
ncbi:MAG: hypothetical protein NTY75_00950 [Candidatus Shapirobacteria bacterium]|nr:hypothetical protein [Candidatus Shapirobacteria bacterium]